MTPDPTARWTRLYQQVPLCDLPRHYANLARSPFLLGYLTRVLERCPRGGRALETGVGSGLGSIWLSRRGVVAEGLGLAPELVERARQANGLLGGSATFRVGDLFALEPPGEGRYDVIHHQGVLEHFDPARLQAALARQVLAARWVVFSVPSVHYPFEPEFGDERLLPLDEWQRLLAPFDVESLAYHGDPALGEREHVLGILRGQAASAALRGLIDAGESPYPEGITAIVHTRNEERRLEEALASLQGWTDALPTSACRPGSGARWVRAVCDGRGGDR